MPKNLLSQYPAIHTSDVDEFEHQLVSIYGATGFDLPHPKKLNVQNNLVHLQDIALGVSTHGTLTRMKFSESDLVRLQVPLRGSGIVTSGTRTAQVGVGMPILASANHPATLQYGDDFQTLFLHVGSAAIERKLAALIGAPVRQRPEFELADFASREMASGLQQLIKFFVQALDSQSFLLSPLALKELEEAVTVQLLFASRHDLSGLLQQEQPEVSPAHINRVEQFIEANWHLPLTTESLVDVSGVSARTLFRSFRKIRGYSPMTFVRKIRLQRARALLGEPDTATSVSGVALKCGFSNLGQFARDYRDTFGELPSETLKRSGSWQ